MSYKIGKKVRDLMQMRAYNKALAAKGAITRRANISSSFRAANIRGLTVFRRPTGELKYVDLAAANYALNATATFTLLNAIRVGSSDFNRIGRKINMKYVYIKGNISQVRTQSVNTEYVRMMVVYDRQPTGVAPVLADIISQVDQAGTRTTGAREHLNIDNMKRFAILADKTLTLPTQTNTAGVITNLGLQDNGQSNKIQMFIKCKNLLAQYNADSAPAVVGDIATGALWLVTFGSVAAASEGFQFTGVIRLRYIDI